MATKGKEQNMVAGKTKDGGGKRERCGQKRNMAEKKIRMGAKNKDSGGKGRLRQKIKMLRVKIAVKIKNGGKN